MDSIRSFPDGEIVAAAGPVAAEFIRRGVKTFHEACRRVHAMPYGYNSNRDDLMILFKEGRGTCTTKHAVIATLASELGLDVHKHVGLYAMTEEIVTGAGRIAADHGLPYVPMVHCFLKHENAMVDLTEGNRNGKNRPLTVFLFTAKVAPNISAKEEYLLYRRALAEVVLRRPEFQGVDIQRVLKAREEGMKLLKANIGETAAA